MIDEDQDEENLIFNPKAVTYPQKGDNFFITNTGGPYVSCLNFQNDHLQLYISGYKDAADTLVNTMKENTSYLDTFLFPALFLYRQYLELSLKAIIRDGNILLGKPQKFLGKTDKKRVPPGKIEYDFPLGHDLVDLWATCNDILEQVDKIYPELKMFEKVDLAALGELFAEFSHEDPGSDAARYPVNLDNHPTFPNWKYLDMFHMKEIMGKIDAYFEGVSAAIMEYVSWQQDIASDYGY